MIIRFSLLRGEGGMFTSVVPLPSNRTALSSRERGREQAWASLWREVSGSHRLPLRWETADEPMRASVTLCIVLVLEGACVLTG